MARKRKNDEDDDGDDDIFPEEGFDEIDFPLEEPSTTRGRPKRRRAARVRGGGASRRGGRGGRRAAFDPSMINPNNLFEVVKQGKSALQSVVDEWIECYKQDRDSALLDLMQFFIQCSGCKGRITPQMQMNLEHAQIIRRMTEEFDEESGDYPLIMGGPMWKKFRSNLCEFIQVLVRQCQYSIIYDQYLMDNVISLLTGLSDSQVRAFRHTATLAAMKLMTALVDVALNLSINMDNTQRQYEAERQKNRDKRATERLEMLMAKRQELEENMEEIKNMMTYMFKSVFVHRYRDGLPDIRSICMFEIGQWMRKFHQYFLDDSYLKYIGWTLHDRVGDVRLKCLQALIPLYGADELTGKLELFTNKFKDRIVAMTLDKEYDVAVQAVKLVISIHKYYRDILSDKDCEHVYELVYSSHRAVGQAAGEFLNERLFQPDEEAVQGIRTKRGKKRSINTPLIRDLVQFFIESELHEHGAYLVDSLIESNLMMKDWECMTDLLIEEPGPEEEALDDRQETSLIEIMVCCIKQAATGDPPVGRGSNRRQPSAKELKQVADDRVKLTEHFIQTLPQLLAKYIADSEKIANLMVISQYCDLEIYTTSRQEKNLDSLLKLIHEIVERHTDSDVLESCAKTYEALCSDELPIHSRCAVAKGTLIDTLVHKYKLYTNEFIHAGDNVDEDELYNITAAMKKINVFYSCHNLQPWDIWDNMFEFWIKGFMQNKNLTEEVIKCAVTSCSAGIMWDLAMLEDTSAMPTGVNTTKARMNAFMETLSELLKQSTELLEETAFVTICDLLIVFCKQLGENSGLTPLVYEPDRDLQILLNNFVQNKVFITEDDEEDDENTKIEELHKRRNFLASYCKLVVYNILNIKQAADVFKHYVRFYNDYGDIIKATLGKAREINKVNCARTMAMSLISLFSELRQLNPDNIINRQDDNFIGIKELAKRFALSFGLDQIKNRDAVAALHQEGIFFAVCGQRHPDSFEPPPNIAFLEILTEFTNKLMKQDKRTVLAYLDRHIQLSMPGTRSEDWQPLIMYRNSLVHGEAEQAPQRIPGRQYRGRKRQRDDEELRNMDDDGNLEMDSDHGSDSESVHSNALMTVRLH